MGIAIHSDSDNSIGNSIFYGVDDSVHGYIASKYDRFISTVQDYGDGFVNRLRDHYEDYITSREVRSDELMKQRMGHIYETNIIRKATSIQEVQSSPNVMRRWVMAEPIIRNRYLSSGVSGYNGEFDNYYPDAKGGEEHYDYRRVMDGVAFIDDDGRAVTHQYFETVNRDEDNLSISQKSIIRNSWSLITTALNSENNEDPTSMWDGIL
jgi:hypothetical protein